MAAQASKLFDISTARVSSDSWRNLQYEISDGAVNMIRGSYSWTALYVYLDNCISARNIRFLFVLQQNEVQYRVIMLLTAAQLFIDES